ncbi:unnamed protein product, partial [Rotaria sordida]
MLKLIGILLFAIVLACTIE